MHSYILRIDMKLKSDSFKRMRSFLLAGISDIDVRHEFLIDKDDKDCPYIMYIYVHDPQVLDILSKVFITGINTSQLKRFNCQALPIEDYLRAVAEDKSIKLVENDNRYISHIKITEVFKVGNPSFRSFYYKLKR